MKKFSILIMLFTASALVIGCDSEDYTPVVAPGTGAQGENVITTREEVETMPATETRTTIIRNNGTKRIQIKFNYPSGPVIRSLAPGAEINADPLGKGTIPTRLVCEEPYHARTDSNECVTYR